MRNQQTDESINDYIVALKKLSIHCNYGEFLNRALRDRLVCGLNNVKIPVKQSCLYNNNIHSRGPGQLLYTSIHSRGEKKLLLSLLMIHTMVESSAEVHIHLQNQSR